jgi:hypothetical protein
MTSSLGAILKYNRFYFVPESFVTILKNERSVIRTNIYIDRNLPPLSWKVVLFPPKLQFTFIVASDQLLSKNNPTFTSSLLRIHCNMNSTQSGNDAQPPTALARLYLEDGTVLTGRSFGCHTAVEGEVRRTGCCLHLNTTLVLELSSSRL